MDFSKLQNRPLVLCVDDDEDVIKTWELYCEMGNLSYALANDFGGAIDVIERKHVGVIISDYRMPGFRGEYLLEFVKQRYPRIVRIMITGYSGDVRQEHGKWDGNAGYRILDKEEIDKDSFVSHAVNALSSYETLIGAEFNKWYERDPNPNKEA